MDTPGTHAPTLSLPHHLLAPPVVPPSFKLVDNPHENYIDNYPLINQSYLTFYTQLSYRYNPTYPHEL